MSDTILVVDDSRAINKMLCGRLEALGDLRAESAATLAETRALLADNPERFMLAILDLTLPDAPNGETVELVRDHDVPVVVLTASLDAQVRRNMLDQQVVDYEVKSGTAGVGRIVDLVARMRHFRDSSILVVDDSKSTRRMIGALLQRRGYQVLEAEHGEQALEVLDSRDDIVMVVTDFHMPGMDGAELTARIRRRHERDTLAVIGLSSGTRGELTIPLLKSGANDFLSKPFEAEEFYARVDQSLDMLRFMQEARDAANRDFLTRLYNRRHFFTAVAPDFDKAQRGEQQLAVVTGDVDHFKSINDSHGHDVGDQVLVQVAGALASALRKGDLLARMGGEEFACAMVVESDDEALALAERLRMRVAALDVVSGSARIPVTMSLGVTMTIGESIDAMLKLADQGLYDAKQAGRNRVCQR